MCAPLLPGLAWPLHRLGRKRVIVWCTVACGALVCISAIAPNYPIYLLARALSGTAGAGQALAGGQRSGPAGLAAGAARAVRCPPLPACVARPNSDSH